MPTLTLTLLFIVIGFAFAFEIARRKKGLLRGILAYFAGFAGVLLATSVATLFVLPTGKEVLDFAKLGFSGNSDNGTWSFCSSVQQGPCITS